MSTSILWTCCKCSDSTESLYLRHCFECYHHRCTTCNFEIHDKGCLTHDWTWNSPENNTRALPEGILFESNSADGRKAHNGNQKSDENITNDTKNDDSCAHQESHVASNSLDPRLLFINPPRETDSGYSSTIDCDKMDIDEEHAEDERPWSRQKVELRKEAIRYQFHQNQEKYSKLAHSNRLKQHQKTLSPYFEQLKDPTCFAFAWEGSALPLLLEFATYWLGTTYTINVLPGSKTGKRTILFMSATKLTFVQQTNLQQHVLDMLPTEFHEITLFQFSTGSVKRTFDTITIPDEDEDCVNPRNPYYYSKPTMGDSVGWHEDQERCAATLGPCLEITEEEESGRTAMKGYWLLNFHLFESAFLGGKWPKSELSIRHPAFGDRKLCNPNNPNEHVSIELGTIEATSGYDCKTTRISQNIREASEALGLDPLPDHVIVDWALSTATKIIPNLPRSQDSVMGEKCRHVTTISSVVIPEALIFSSGRSSGFQYGQISQCPAVLSGACNGTGITTREWAVFGRYSEDETADDDNQFGNSGIGIFGDSGASIIDSASNKLYGQVWGGHTNLDTGPRMAYFTDINDIFGHIKERYPKFIKIELARCDGDEGFAVPGCTRCHESQRLSQQLSEATRQVQSVELGQQSNSDVDSPNHLQDSDSGGSLTARLGSPLNYFETLELEAEEISFLGTDIQRENNSRQSSTNLTDDRSEVRSPSSIPTPYPRDGQNWLAGIASEDPFFGAAMPTIIDDGDLFGSSDINLLAGGSDRSRDAREAPEGTGNWTYDAVSGSFKVVKKQRIGSSSRLSEDLT